MDPLQQSGRRKKRIQKNYAREKLDKAQEELEQLCKEVQVLNAEQAQLQAKHDAFVACMQLADMEFYRAAASRLALGRQATELLRQEQRLQCSLASLPPPELWDDRITHRIDALSRDELRYVMLSHYREAMDMLSSANSSPAALSHLDDYAKKHKALAYRCFYNPGAWISLIRANLETGEQAAAPSGWYGYVAMSLPKAWFPQDFIPFLREGMALYHARVGELLKRRQALCQQVQALMQALPAASSEQFLRGRNYDQQQLLKRIVSSASSALGSPSGIEEAPEVVTLERAEEGDSDGPYDPVTALERVLGQLMDTIRADLRSNTLLLEYVLQRIPHRIFAASAAISYPYNVHMPSVLDELLRVYGNASMSTKAITAKSMSQGSGSGHASGTTHAAVSHDVDMDT